MQIGKCGAPEVTMALGQVRTSGSTEADRWPPLSLPLDQRSVLELFENRVPSDRWHLVDRRSAVPYRPADDLVDDGR